MENPIDSDLEGATALVEQALWPFWCALVRSNDVPDPAAEPLDHPAGSQ
jgi:hypothetical protein